MRRNAIRSVSCRRSLKGLKAPLRVAALCAPNCTFKYEKTVFRFRNKTCIDVSEWFRIADC